MPTKQLPPLPSFDDFKDEAAQLRAAHAAGDLVALQRIREFNPRFTNAEDPDIAAAKFTMTDAQKTIAREYGFATWGRLKVRVDALANRTPAATNPGTEFERIYDAITDRRFRHAVELIDAGDIDALNGLLVAHPKLLKKRLHFEGVNYFRTPALLDFVAENPVRRDAMPWNIVAIARAILDAGAKDDPLSVNETLGLVSSGRVPREHKVQVALIDLLCDYGADPSGAITAALGHGEFEAVEALVRRGAVVDLPAAAALGRVEDAERLVPEAAPAERHRALAYAAQFGRVEIVRLLLDAGEDPNRFNPVGCHSHSTPLHQAVIANHVGVVELLLERGADASLKDIVWNATPLGWAEYAGHAHLAELLTQSREGS